MHDTGTDHTHDPHDAPVRQRADGAFRVGIGGPVGTGKTALVAALCALLSDELRIGVVTNDIYTTEDADTLKRRGVLDARVGPAVRGQLRALDALLDLADAGEVFVEFLLVTAREIAADALGFARDEIEDGALLGLAQEHVVLALGRGRPGAEEALVAVSPSWPRRMPAAGRSPDLPPPGKAGGRKHPRIGFWASPVPSRPTRPRTSFHSW